MKRKIVLSLVSLFVLFSFGVAAATWHVSNTTDELRHLVKLHRVENLRRGLVISVQTVQADLYTAHTALARKLDAIVANVAEMDQAASGCLECHHAPRIEAKLEEIEDRIDEFKNHLSYYITTSANKERIDRLELEVAEIGNEILARTEEMSQTASARLEQITLNATERINNVRGILLATLLGTTAAGIAISVYLARSVTRPVEQLVGATRVIAAGGLGHRLELREETEFGELAKHFNAMSTALKQSYEGLEAVNADLRHEIQQRRQAEEEREQLQGQLLHAHKMQALGTLSAGIAHEFNNALQVIQGSVESLGSEEDLGEGARRDVEVIGSATERAADLTRRLLMFSSKSKSQPLVVDLNERVRHVKQILRRALPESIRIRVHLAPDLPPVSADPTQLEQVVLNLALNAKDAMPDGGTLEIETWFDPPRSGPDEPAANGEEGWVRLRVSDTGHGMDDETLRHAFDPFFTTKEFGAGTGLGLSTVYGIVTGCGGRIDCRSAVGRGTAFDIRLPALPGAVVSAAQPTAPRRPVARGVGTLLLVDDETTLLEVMRHSLERQGYVVHVASDGEEAVRFFAERGQEVDVVVLDLAMPGMGGRACLQRLLEIQPDARVVISTAYGTLQNEKELMEAGASGFLGKPYRIREIRDVVDGLLAT